MSFVRVRAYPIMPFLDGRAPDIEQHTSPFGVLLYMSRIIQTSTRISYLAQQQSIQLQIERSQVQTQISFFGYQIFSRKIQEISHPEHSRPATSILYNSCPFKTGHFPSRLSPKNETGIPEFPKIQYCLGIFLLGAENSNTKQDQTRPGKKNFLRSIFFLNTSPSKTIF